jgi:TIR domain
MAASPPPVQGRIFISYRREESAYPAGWLYDRLAERFGGGQVFKDVDSIELGDDFVEVITRAVGSCDVLLALIGEEWLTITDEHGRRRLNNPDDFVRLEIEAALARRVRVIPILVDGARMPRPDELPASLARLARRQALELSPSRFDFDTSRLFRVLDRTLAEVRTAQDDSASMRPPAGKAPDPSTTKAQQAPDPSTTKAQQAPERREQARGGPAPSVPPGDSATSGGAWRSADQRKPPDKQRRRLSMRARILAGAAVGVVLIVVLIVIITANSGTAPPPAGAVNTTTPSSTRGAIFRDDFSGKSNGWDVVDDASHSLRYVDGTYQILTKQPGDYLSFPRARYEQLASLPSVRVEVDARRLTGAEGNGYGVVCRYQRSGDSYVFNITNDGYYRVAKLFHGKTIRLKGPAASDAINSSSLYHLQAQCSQDAEGAPVRLVLTVDGRRIAEVIDRDDPLPLGGIGVSAHNKVGGGPIAFGFDNFVVEKA